MTAPSAFARATVRRRVEAQMTASVTVYRGDLGAMDPETGDVGGLANAQTVYQGKARVRTVSGAGVLAVGEGTIETRSTIVSIPIDSPMVRRDDVIEITDELADTELDARFFRVLDVDAGSMFADARRMTCQGFAGSRWWSDQ